MPGAYAMVINDDICRGQCNTHTQSHTHTHIHIHTHTRTHKLHLCYAAKSVPGAYAMVINDDMPGAVQDMLEDRGIRVQHTHAQ